MAVTALASGTQTATLTTEHSLTTTTTAGVYVLMVDIAALIDGEILELRLKRPALASGTTRVAYVGYFIGAVGADDELAVSVPIPHDGGASNTLDFTLLQRNGTGRAFPWKVLSL